MNQSDVHYWCGVACDALGNRPAAKQHWQRAARSHGDFQHHSLSPYSEKTYYSALALERLGKKAEAKKLLRELMAYARGLQKTKAKPDYFATGSVPEALLFGVDLQWRQQSTGLLLEALAMLGLGKKKEARRLLSSILKRDPNHALAADFAAATGS
jgi:TolA-binding protein